MHSNLKRRSFDLHSSYLAGIYVPLGGTIPKQMSNMNMMMVRYVEPLMNMLMMERLPGQPENDDAQGVRNSRPGDGSDCS